MGVLIYEEECNICQDRGRVATDKTAMTKGEGRALLEKRGWVYGTIEKTSTPVVACPRCAKPVEPRLPGPHRLVPHQVGKAALRFFVKVFKKRLTK